MREYSIFLRNGIIKLLIDITDLLRKGGFPMSNDNVKGISNEKDDSLKNANELTNKENECCAEECNCSLFDYKRPTAEEAKKTKRKTCC